jgi:hypothetical protein
MHHSASPQYRAQPPWTRSVGVRWCLLLAVSWLGLGCKNPGLIGPSTSPDVGRLAIKGDASADAVDAAYVLQVPDVRRGDASEDSACSRSVNLRGVTITRPVPFDVVIVADNSDSLSWSRDSLSAGLKNLLARVHGHEARFFVLTTTQYGASSQAAVSPLTGKDLVSWHDSVSSTAYSNAVTTYDQVCTDGAGVSRTCPKAPPVLTESWKVKGTWRFSMPAPVAAITPDMDDAAVEAEQKRIADAILALGGGGSQQEQPICTLLRYIGQNATALPKHAVFVVLTDEDDTSPPDVCLAGYDAYQQVNFFPSEVLCDSNCTRYVYMVYKPYQELGMGFTCVPVDDKGTAHPERAASKSLVLQTAAQCAGDAGTSTTGACTEAELARASVECGAGNVVQSCTHTCTVGRSVLQCDLSRTDNKTNLCTQPFDVNGVQYANMDDYCSRSRSFGSGWKDCEVRGIMPSNTDAGTYASYEEHTTPLVSAKSTADMIQSFKTSADRTIGKGNYSIEAIVLDPAFNCPLHSGQSYAPNLRTLATSAGDVFPLCEDYAPAIERIASFANYLVQTTFPLDLDEYEDIDSVVVTSKQGVQRTAATNGYTYDRDAKLLRFNAGALTAQDESLAVNVARYCEVIIK